MPSKKKKYNARFPPARIKKIMQIDEDVGKVAAAVPVIISRALEMFVESLLKKAFDVTTSRSARTLTPSHIKCCITSEARFDFLKDLVAGVPDLQGDCDDLPQAPSGSATPVTGGQACPSAFADRPVAAKATTNAAKAGHPLTLPRQLSTPKPRGRPSKAALAAAAAASTEPSSSSCPSKRMKPKKEKKPKKRQKVTKYVDDDGDDDVFVGSGNSDSSPEEESSSEKVAAANGHAKSNGNHSDAKPSAGVTSHPPSATASKHLPAGLAAATATSVSRPTYSRSFSYTAPTAFMQRSEQVISSGGVSFSLSFPIPLSPALPPFTNTNAQKGLFGLGLSGSGSGQSQGNGAAASSTTSSPAPWSTQNAIDEDYDA